jgi:hypothetical protein
MFEKDLSFTGSQLAFGQKAKKRENVKCWQACGEKEALRNLQS